MAWYALYKWFRTFRKSPYVNYVDHYRNYLYDQWFNGLSLEEQEAEVKRIEKEKEARRMRVNTALAMLYGMNFLYQGKWTEPW